MIRLLVAVAGTFACGVPLGVFVGWSVTAKLSPVLAAPFALVMILGIVLGAYIVSPKP